MSSQGCRAFGGGDDAGRKGGGGDVEGFYGFVEGGKERLGYCVSVTYDVSPSRNGVLRMSVVSYEDFLCCRILSHADRCCSKFVKRRERERDRLHMYVGAYVGAYVDRHAWGRK